MSKACFIADTHFNHANINDYCRRPFSSIEEHDEILIKNWNEVVEPGDDIYHMGDFAFGKPEYIERVLRRLNGNKHLIYGNHDAVIRKSKSLQSYFNWCKDIHEIKIDDEDNPYGKQGIILCHYAMRTWNHQHHGYYMTYGHSHNTLLDDPNLLSFDVGVDSVASYLADWYPIQNYKAIYRPMTYDEVKLRMWRKRESFSSR